MRCSANPERKWSLQQLNYFICAAPAAADSQRLSSRSGFYGSLVENSCNWENKNHESNKSKMVPQSSRKPQDWVMIVWDKQRALCILNWCTATIKAFVIKVGTLQRAGSEWETRLESSFQWKAFVHFLKALCCGKCQTLPFNHTLQWSSLALLMTLKNTTQRTTYLALCLQLCAKNDAC